MIIYLNELESLNKMEFMNKLQTGDIIRVTRFAYVGDVEDVEELDGYFFGEIRRCNIGLIYRTTKKVDEIKQWCIDNDFSNDPSFWDDSQKVLFKLTWC